MKERITLHFEPAHAKKLLSGKGVCQLSADHISGKKGVPLEVEVHRSVATRLRKASRGKKASRVRIDELGGEGIKEWFQNLGKKIKDGYQKVKPQLAPLIKQGVGKLADLAQDASKPFLPAQVNQLIADNKQKAVDFIGQQTGAYGVMPLYGYGALPLYGYGAVTYPQPVANWSTMAMPLAPPMMSKNPYPGWGFPQGYGDTTGQGFRVI
jgi:hypothetical protein